MLLSFANRTLFPPCTTRYRVKFLAVANTFKQTMHVARARVEHAGTRNQYPSFCTFEIPGRVFFVYSEHSARYGWHESADVQR